jgi:hypothetical protein
LVRNAERLAAVSNRDEGKIRVKMPVKTHRKREVRAVLKQASAVRALEPELVRRSRCGKPDGCRNPPNE